MSPFLQRVEVRGCREMLWAVMKPVGVIVLCLAVFAAGDDGFLDRNIKATLCTVRDPVMNPTYEVIHGQDTVWQIPRNPRGVLHMAHAWNLNPFSFFDRSSGCQQCVGLPEHRRLVVDALQRGYAVIAVKSIGDHYDAWPLDSDDLVVVENILNDWRREHSLDNLPFVSFGYSAGGHFATSLAARIHTDALLLMCCEGLPVLIESATPDLFPPTFFVYMGFEQDAVATRGGNSVPTKEIVARLGDDTGPPTEMTSKEDVENSIRTLREKGVRVEGKYLWPEPVTSHYFTKHLPCATAEISERMQSAYRAEGWFNSSGYLCVDPIWGDFAAPLKKWDAIPAWYQPEESCSFDHVCQELAKAYAFHAFTGDADEEIFFWLDSFIPSNPDVVTNIEEFRAFE